MAVARWAFRVLVAIVLAATPSGVSAGDDAEVIPFVAGTAWTYQALLKWTDPPNTLRRSEVRWTSIVIDAFDHGDVAGALLQGGVWDLAWWSRDQRPGIYEALRVGTRYYLLRDVSRSAFAAVKTAGRSALPANLDQHVWFDVPLTKGRVLRPRDMGRRDDTNYGWWIESAGPARLEVPGLRGAARKAFRLSYDTLASEQHDTIVPGVGITAFTYVHNGTLAEAYAHLIAFRRGPAR
ncbi:MAG TPA: hypothetical protein VE826_05580 [Dongiaceae bacterium]|nr:hypothetical protein [Dongiaceae bacterium]